jgi:hypothetical protein
MFFHKGLTARGGRFLILSKTLRSMYNEVDVPYVLESVYVCICFAYCFHFMHKLQTTHWRNMSCNRMYLGNFPEEMQE